MTRGCLESRSFKRYRGNITAVLKEQHSFKILEMLPDQVPRLSLLASFNKMLFYEC